MPLSDSRKVVVTCLTAIVVVGAALRFYEIGKLPLWDAEAVTLWFSQQPMSELWHSIPRWDFHPPLFATLLKAWSIFGEEEAVLRSLSAAFGILTIPLVYLLGHLSAFERDRHWVGLGAALLFAVSPLHVEYAQEARYQAAWTFAVVATLSAAAWLMRHPVDACTPLIRRRSGAGFVGLGISTWPTAVSWLALSLGCALTLWLHNLSVFFVAALLVAFLVWESALLRWNRQFLLNALGAAVVVLALWAPFLEVLWVQSSNLSEQFYIPTPTLLDVAFTIDYWFGVNYLHYGSFLPLAGLAAAGVWTMSRRDEWPLAMLLVCASAIPVLGVLGVSYAFKPILLFRTMIWVSVPYLVVIAAGAAVATRAWARVSLILGASVLFGLGTANYYESSVKSPWDRIASFIGREGGPRGVALTIPNVSEVALDYYLRDQDHSIRAVGLPRPFPAPGMANPYPFDVTTGPGMTEKDVGALRELIRNRSPVWFVMRSGHLFDPQDIVLRVLNEEMRFKAEASFLASDDPLFGGISVYKFE